MSLRSEGRQAAISHNIILFHVTYSFFVWTHNSLIFNKLIKFLKGTIFRVMRQDFKTFQFHCPRFKNLRLKCCGMEYRTVVAYGCQTLTKMYYINWQIIKTSNTRFTEGQYPPSKYMMIQVAQRIRVK